VLVLVFFDDDDDGIEGLTIEALKWIELAT